ncbi:hypothetical protein N7490_002421, partial [Penicillium lividum]
MGAKNMFSRKARSSDTFVLLAMCFALFTDTFVYGLIVPILPFLLMENGSVPTASVQKWTSILLASYGGALLVGSPVVGYFCDRYHARKSPLISGFVAIVFATVLFISAHSPWLLVVARVCQGLSGAVVGVLGLSMIAETASQEHFQAYMACGSTALTWGMLCGPMAGGFLFAKFGIAGAFGLPIALLVVDIVLRLLIVDEQKEDKGKDAEPCYESEDSQEESPLLFSKVSSNSSLSIYNYLHPIFLGVMFSVLAVSCILSAYETTLPLYVMETYNWTSMGAGFVFIPLTVPAILSIAIAHYTRKLKPRTIVMIGFLLMAVPMLALRWTQGNTIKHESLLVCMLLIIGICVTTVQAITIGTVPNAIQKIEGLYGVTEKGSGQGRGYAFCNMAFAGGQAIGPVLAGLLKHKVGWAGMTLSLAGLCFFAGILAFFSTPAAQADVQESEEDE